MEFAIDRNTFLKGVSLTQGFVEKKSTVPILANILIETEKDNISITATDLEIGIKALYPANVEAEGKITVSAKKIYEIVRELPDNIVFFKVNEKNWIEIKCGKSVFNIVGLSSEEYPFFPDTEKGEFCTIDDTVIKDMIDATYFSMSTDDSKYSLNGIYLIQIMENEKNRLRMVATDGHRLSLIDKKIEDNISSLEKGCILPRKGILELRKFIEEEQGSLGFKFMDNNIVFSKEETMIVMRLVDGDFPDYKRVIPELQNKPLQVNRSEFMHVLKRISILTSENTKGVKLELSNNKLNIRSSSPEYGEANEEVDAVFSGDNMAIGFNARFMLDILKYISSENIEFHIKDEMSPGIIKPDTEEEYLAVVMPMRL